MNPMSPAGFDLLSASAGSDRRGGSIAGEETRYLFATFRQWRMTVAIAAIVTAALAPWYWFISGWIGTAVFVMTSVTIHGVHAARFIVPLPHIAVLIAGLQYVLAPWLNFYYPLYELQDIGIRLPLYLEYAVPALIAAAIGWGIAMRGVHSTRDDRPRLTPALSTKLDVLLGVGVFFGLIGRLVDAPNLAFALLLLANLRYVGLFGQMISGASGWRWRALFILGFEAVVAAKGAMFHDLLLWCAWTFAVWMFSASPRRLTVFLIAAAGVIFLPALQLAKGQLRLNDAEDEILTRDSSTDQLGLDRTTEWLSYLADGIVQTSTLRLDPAAISDMAARFNQGWIVNRVMLFVPEVQPYAAGETIRDALVGAIIPRVVMEKKTAGGSEAMQRFSGMQTTENTSMGLGFMGEAYANFGHAGGIAACGVYALGFGLLFRVFCVKAKRNNLWWSLVPYVFYSAIKVEDNFDFVANWTVKSALIIIPLILAIPELRGGASRTQVAGPTEDAVLRRAEQPLLH